MCYALITLHQHSALAFKLGCRMSLHYTITKILTGLPPSSLQSAGSQPLETGVPQKSVGHQPAVEGPLGLNRAWTCIGQNQYAPRSK